MLGRKPNLRVGGDFQTAPADKYTVQITDVNFVTGFNTFKNVEEEKLKYSFVILDDKKFDGSDGETVSTRGIKFNARFSQSLNERANLTKMVKAVLGRDLTKEELDPKNPKFFNPESLIGKQVDVMLTEDDNKDKTGKFNNVASYVTTKKQLPSLDIKPTGQTVVESESTSTNVVVDTPNLNPELDKFLGGLEEPEEEVAEAEETEESEEEEESLEELEAKIKLAKAKAKKAKADK